MATTLRKLILKMAQLPPGVLRHGLPVSVQGADGWRATEKISSGKPTVWSILAFSARL